MEDTLLFLCFYFYCCQEYIFVTLIVFSTCFGVVVHGGNSPRLDVWWTIGCINTHMQRLE